MRALSALTLALFLTATAQAAQSIPPDPGETAAGIRFVWPKPLATVLGPSEAEVEIAPPPGRSIVRVEIALGGKRLAALREPPWIVAWDAGPEGGNHLLEAVAVLDDGERLSATVQTSRLRIDQVEEVALVTLYAIAKDEASRYVTDLGREEFALFENGRPQAIDRFSAERRPLRVAIVLDASLSMSVDGAHGEDRIGAAREAALEFVEALEPGDEGIVASFSDDARVLQERTSDRSLLRTALSRVKTGGGTALYDAIWETTDRLRELDGRRVLLLLSDGKDEAASGLEPGSLHTLEEALDRAIRNDVMIFAIGLGQRIARDAKRLEQNPRARASELDFFGRTPLATILNRIAWTTGGRAIFTSSAGKIRKAFEEVALDLRHQYSLAYRSDDPRRDGAWREIRLTVSRPGILVNSRAGYYAPRPAGGAALR